MNSKTQYEEIKSISEFLEQLFFWERKNKEEGKTIIFRGESEKFKVPCISSLGRFILDKGTSEKEILRESKSLENKILKQWVSDSELSEEFLYPANSWTQLMWARHHGLMCRLTDWTTNPLVSLFMACSESEEDNGFVYICMSELDHLETIKSKHFDKSEAIHNYDLNRAGTQTYQSPQLKQMFLYPPRDFHRRIKRQSGVFHSSIDPVKSALDGGFKVKIFTIPSDKKLKIMEQLSVCNIDRLSLAIDTPDSIATNINENMI